VQAEKIATGAAKSHLMLPKKAVIGPPSNARSVEKTPFSPLFSSFVLSLFPSLCFGFLSDHRSFFLLSQQRRFIRHPFANE